MDTIERFIDTRTHKLMANVIIESLEMKHIIICDVFYVVLTLLSVIVLHIHKTIATFPVLTVLVMSHNNALG